MINPKNNSYKFLKNFKFIILIIIISIISFFYYINSIKEVNRANELRMESHLLVDKLRQSSNKLTSTVRNYVFTGNHVFKQRYQDILDIRDGKKPRPINKYNFYWDLLPDDNKSQLLSSSTTISLLKLMRQKGFSKIELSKLAEAKKYSDILTSIELEAMRLVESANNTGSKNRIKAISILHDQNYKNYKIKIMKPIYDVYEMMDKRVVEVIKSAKNASYIFLVIFIFFSTLFLFYAWSSYKSLKLILGASVDELHANISKIGQEDFTTNSDISTYAKDSVMQWVLETHIKLIKAKQEQYISEKALEASEMRFRHILEAVPALSVQGYGADGTTHYWNKASEKVYGYTAKEAIGKNLLDLIIPPDMRTGVREAMDEMFESGEIISSRELTLMKKDRSNIEVFSSHALVYIPGHAPEMFCIDIDITERKKAELKEKSRSHIMELITSEVSLSEILEAIVLSIEKQNPTMICSILLLDDSGKHLLHGAAPSLPDFYNKAIDGIEIGDGVGSCGTAAFNGEQVVVEDIQSHKYWALFKELASEANLASCWSTPILSSKNEILGTFAIYHHHASAPSDDDIESIKEITALASVAIEKNKSNIALKTSEKRFKSIYENNPAGIFVVNKDRNITTVNQQFCNIMGYSSDEIVGENTSVIHVSKESHLAFKEIFFKVKNRSRINIEYQLKKKNGEIIWCELFGSNFESGKENDATLWSIMDISSRKIIEEKLKLSSTVFTHAREGIMITDADANIIEVNDTFSMITGYPREEIIGKNPNILSSGKHKSEFYKEVWDSLVIKKHWYGEMWNCRSNGEVYAQMMTISAVLDDKGEVQNYVSLFSDITLAKEHQGQLEHIAHYDSLTNLPNRVLLADRLSQAMMQCRRNNKLVFVLYIDLDGFKDINDTHGHNVGDEFLIEVSRRMADTLRDGDTLSRFGGDEFVAVLADLVEFEDCELILNRILRAASEAVTIDGAMMNVSASIGVTMYPDDDVDADLLMRHADQAMYVAKQDGKNRYHVFDTVHDSAIKIKQENLNHIKKALSYDEFVLYYQPKVNMKTGEIIGVEALIRWQHPTRGLVPPIEFLPVIENHEISVELGEWVIDTALSQIESWREEGLDMPISVNIGALQIQQSNFSSRLADLLKSHPKVQPSYLELEILETSALSDIEDVSKTMNACINLGVSFALDDFGTGYSSLTYMRYLPASLIKIDQTFVHDILTDSNDLEIVKGVIGLAEAFKRNVIAEGVETIEHGTALLKVGCVLAQGYGIARPMPSLEMKKWVQMWKSDISWKSK